MMSDSVASVNTLGQPCTPFLTTVLFFPIPPVSEMSRILILNTGGTIGMRATPVGLQPETGYLAELLEGMEELRRPGMPAFEVRESDPLLDSSDMTPEVWWTIAREIADHHDAFDGFVVLHGTDTMAYTTSALAFMLEGLRKPVIFTGAQLPLGEIRNDARENLVTALMLATDPRIQEVGLFFGEVLLRGCRATKVSASRLDAFASPNFPPLASAETQIEVFAHRLRPPRATGGVRVHSLDHREVATFHMFPGMSLEILSNLLRRPLRALILQSYGVGNGPVHQPGFLELIREATARGTLIVNLTQCQHGCVSQTSYATGLPLEQAGVISGFDMTIEAAIAKLMFVLSQPLEFDAQKELMRTDLVGELTVALPNR